MRTLPAPCAAASAAGAAGTNPEPGRQLQPQNAFAAQVPIRGWRWPAGTEQCVRASVSQDCGGSRPSLHLTGVRPYRRRLELQPLRGVVTKHGPHCCDSGARIGCRTCVPRSAQR
ncbi:hypothetical protein STEG23_032600 [Scotinomys teguina]